MFAYHILSTVLQYNKAMERVFYLPNVTLVIPNVTFATKSYS